MTAPNTVVVGSSKTGTTGLFSAVWQGMRAATDGHCYGLPEKDDPDLLWSLQRLAPDRTLAAKFLLTSVDYSEQLLEPFDRHLMTVRDPRDTLLSVALFVPVQAVAQGADDEQVSAFIDLVRKKEDDPASVDFVELFAAVHRLLGQSMEPGRIALRRFRTAMGHADRHRPHIVHYERFVRDELDDVSELLGFEVRNVRPSKRAAFVYRSGGAGEWRHWFTDRDVEVLRPKLAPYMERFGYDPDDWELPRAPAIEPAHGSRYVESSVAERRRQRGLFRGEGSEDELIEHLRGTAADGSVRGALRVARLLHERDPRAHATEVRDHLAFAAAGGDVRAMRHLAQLLADGPSKVRDARQARRWRAEAETVAERRRQARRVATLSEELRRTRGQLRRLRRSRGVRLVRALARARRDGPRTWHRLPSALWAILRAPTRTQRPAQ